MCWSFDRLYGAKELHMLILLVVDSPKEWPLHIPNVTVLGANAYLTDPKFADCRNVRVFNLCRSYRYQSRGYYVSLLAAARGHKPIPSVTTVQDMKLQTMIRMVSEDIDELIQKSLATIQSRKFTMSIYFGHNLAKKHDRISVQLFNLFQAPLIRAHFARANGNRWQLQNIAPIAVKDIPAGHRPFVVRAAMQYFKGRRFGTRKRKAARYSMAILHDPKAQEPPSDEKALSRFARAAESLGIEVEFVTKDDFSRLVEFDALFIRDTTFVNHYTYRFSRRAAAEGLVVIDDPESILKCTNKVYLAELLDRYDVPAPRTVILHDDNLEEIASGALGFPCVLKQPDSAFSLGVEKVDDRESLLESGRKLLARSELVVAQEYVPTEFDWRIGIFDRKPLYACRYYMARKHWQIIRRDADRQMEGAVDALPVELAPVQAVRTALRAANLIGDGLYGVDIKQVGRTFYVIEVNDNPSIEAGYEDAVLKHTLYERIMEGFLRRLEEQRTNRIRS